MRVPRKEEKAFTLIEMVMVIAIIGLLVSIAIPALNSAKTDAKEAKKAAIGAAVAAAKIRTSLEQDGLGGTPARFAGFQKFLVVDGSNPSLEKIAWGASNGTYENIVSWGNYPDEGGSEIAWGSGPPVTE